MYFSIIFYSITYYLLVIFVINYLKSMVYSLSIILVSTILITVFNYFGVLNGLVFRIIMLLIPLIGIFVGGFMIGVSSNRKGYIEGLKYGLIWFILLIIVNLITKNFDIFNVIYYFCLVIISMISGVLGINKRKNN